MLTHVKILGGLYIAFGALGLLFALAAFLAIGGAAGIVRMTGPEDAAVSVPILGLIALVVFVVTLMMSLPGIIIGWGLLKMRPWSRIAGIVISLIALLAFPLGTVLGGYGLWVLLSPATEPLFAVTEPLPPTTLDT